MFEKSLQDLVKGIRTHKRDPGPFISQAISEIKQELKSKDDFLKAQAIRKLTYLQMLGYDMSWASFLVIETMSMTRFAHKRIGYLAAAQSFTESTDVVLLTTNLLKKELVSDQSYNISLAINCLSNIVTPDLARDLLQDLLNMMASPKPYIRKKAVTAMYKLYLKYPQGLRLTFDKLKEHLDDGDISVVSATVNVICELAHKNPRNFLAMAPKFFRLLTTTSNNWMLIKVVKLLGSLVAEEPRLARKLLEPLATIIQNTGAKSLLFECIYTVTKALPHTKKTDGSEARNAPAIVKLCSDQLKLLVEDPDANLKYLGLLALSELMKSHPRPVMDHKDNILKCLNDDDVTIRTRALDLLTGMVTKRNLEELVHKLLHHVGAAEGTYRDELINKILYMCSRDKYANLEDFAWYMSVLVDLAHLQGSSKYGPTIAKQICDVNMRVDSVRAYTVEAMLKLILDPTVILKQSALADVLSAGAWIVGEYIEEIEELQKPDTLTKSGENIYLAALDALTHPNLTNLSPDVQGLYIQNAFKVFVAACGEVGDEDLTGILNFLGVRLKILMQSVHCEVQERSTSFRALLIALGVLADEVDSNDSGDSSLLNSVIKTASAAVGGGVAACRVSTNLAMLRALIAEPIRAVNPKAQRKVPVPDDIDLEIVFDQDAINALFDEDDRFEGKDIHSVFFTHMPETNFQDNRNLPDSPQEKFRPKQSNTAFAGSDSEDSDADGQSTKASTTGNYTNEPSEISLGGDLGGYIRPEEEAGAFYLGGANKKLGSIDVDAIPVLTLTAEDLKGSKKKKKDKTKKRSKKAYAVDTEELMPVGAVSDDDEVRPSAAKPKTDLVKKKGKGADPSDLSNVDLTMPLRPDEKIPELKHREVQPGEMGYERDKRKDKDKKTKDDQEASLQKDSSKSKKDKKDEKKDKKNKKEKDKEKSSSKKKSGKPGATGDLLDLMNFDPIPMNPQPMPPPSAIAAPNPAMDISNLLSDFASAPAATAEDDKDKKSKKKKEKKGEEKPKKPKKSKT